MHNDDRPATQQVLRAFSSCLLALGDVTHGTSVDQIVADAMRLRGAEKRSGPGRAL